MRRITNQHNKVVNDFFRTCFIFLSKNNDCNFDEFNNIIEKIFNIKITSNFKDIDKIYIKYCIPYEWCGEFDSFLKVYICYFLLVAPCYLKNDLLMCNKYDKCNDNLKYFLSQTEWSLRVTRSFNMMNIFFDKFLSINRTWSEQKTDYFELCGVNHD